MRWYNGAVECDGHYVSIRVSNAIFANPLAEEIDKVESLYDSTI